eukprot:2081512-Alexandrium_andersonii.AAC.1
MSARPGRRALALGAWARRRRRRSPGWRPRSRRPPTAGPSGLQRGVGSTPAGPQGRTRPRTPTVPA